MSSQRVTFKSLGEVWSKLIGWANHFCLGPVIKAYATADSHARHRLRQWLCAKHKPPGQGTSRYPDEYLHQMLGLMRLSM